MNLTDVTRRALPPAPWVEGDNIPWNDVAFSQRMLKEHLEQDSDAASRRFEKIDEQVCWIDEELLAGHPTRVLDLACGPGLYTSRLARRGHECSGIDFAPAAIEYAGAEALRDDLACRYALADARDAAFGKGFGLAMMLFGQFNVFRRIDAQTMLARAFEALAPDGVLLLEPQRYATVANDEDGPTSWYSASEGLFSSRPHLCLTETFWDAQSRTSTQRFLIVDAATAEVTRYALSNEAYTDEEYVAVVGSAGFEDIRLLPSLIGVEDPSQSSNLVVVARKPAT
jgi:SAM-dependent methyltransferase